MTTTKPHELPVQDLDRVTIRFAGDSGDGMQLTGTQFTRTAAVFGNDISTLPDYPAEIRAPAGSIPGVSGFQISFSSSEIHTPGDAPDVLMAMNPAALRANIGDLTPGGAIIVNADAFTPPNLAKAGYATNPLRDDSLKGSVVFEIPISTLNARALEGLDVTSKQADLTRNFFALGVMFWLYGRTMDTTLAWIDEKFGSRPVIAEANRRALNAGYAFGETTEIFHTTYRVAPATLAPGEYRNITGNEATALGFLTGARLADRTLVYASYPITPASDILHQFSAWKNHGVRDVPGRGRDRGHGRRPRRRVRRGARAHRDVRARHGPQGGNARAGRDGGAPGRRRERPAWRPLDGAADEGRAERPPAGDVQPQRRQPAADRRPGDPGRVLRLRDPGDPDRAAPHDSGHLPVGRVPGQRVGAVADPRRTDAARPAGRRTGPRRPASTPTRAIPRRSPGRGPSPARPASSTASAGSRSSTSWAR